MKAIKNLLGGLLLVIVLILLDREIGQEKNMDCPDCKKIAKRHTAIVWVWAGLLLLALLGLMNKCLLAQTDSVRLGLTPPGVLAFTGCDSVRNVPIITMGYGMDDRVYEIVLAHEKIHAKRMREFKGGCMAFRLKYNTDAGFQLKEEMEAFCGSHYKMSKGFDQKKYAIDRITLLLWDNYKRPPIGYTYFKRMVEERCVSLGGPFEWPP